MNNEEFDVDYVVANWENVFLVSYQVHVFHDAIEIEFTIEDESGVFDVFYFDEFPEDSAAYRDLKSIYDVNVAVVNQVVID